MSSHTLWRDILAGVWGTSQIGVLRTSTIVPDIEDDAALRALLGHGLRDLGYTVLTACAGPEALELCGQDAPIDLLFTDVIMPGMNGWELMERLTARAPGLKTLFMSGYTDDILGPQGALGATAPLLRKPFTPAEAARQIRQVLAGA